MKNLLQLNRNTGTLVVLAVGTVVCLLKNWDIFPPLSEDGESLYLSLDSLSSSIKTNSTPVVTKADIALYEENEERLRVLRKACQKLGPFTKLKWHEKCIQNRPKKIQKRCFNLYIPEYNLATCWVLKGGSTTWFKHLSSLPKVKWRKRDAFNKYYYVLRAGDNVSATQSSAFSFISTRHPLDRLVSAFRFKLDKVRKAMRKAGFRFSGRNPTFHEFTTYFVTRDPDKENLHFSPVWARCDPCSMHLNFIGKMETFNRDADYLIHKLDLPVQTTADLKANVGPKNQEVDYYSRASDAYSTLTMKEIQTLFDMYKIDAELFDYSVEPYLKMAKDYKE